jgi:hypothetical protein
MFKLATLSEQPDVVAVLTPEQHEDFDVPSTALTYLLMGTVSGTLFASGALLAVLIGREEVRRQQQLRSARARRLLYLVDDQEVILPKLPPLDELLPIIYPIGADKVPTRPHAGPFHVFLSHNWEQCARHRHTTATPPVSAMRPRAARPAHRAKPPLCAMRPRAARPWCATLVRSTAHMRLPCHCRRAPCVCGCVGCASAVCPQWPTGDARGQDASA